MFRHGEGQIDKPPIESYGDTVEIGGEPIPASTWSLDGEDQMPVSERLQIPGLIGKPLKEIDAADAESVVYPAYVV